MRLYCDSHTQFFCLDVERTDTVCVLRRLIFQRIGMKPGDQCLTYDCKLLGSAPEHPALFAFDDTQTLESQGITDDKGILHVRARFGTSKREFVPDEESYSSKQKRRALSNAVAPHARRAERLRSERDEALAARERLTSERDEALAGRTRARAARDEARAARDAAQSALAEARTALAAPRCSGIAAGSVVNMSDTALKQLHEQLLSAQAVLAREQQRRLDAERDSKLCVVCLDRPKTFMSRACNHLALCEACIPDGASPCPVCRVATSQWGRVYA